MIHYHRGLHTDIFYIFACFHLYGICGHHSARRAVRRRYNGHTHYSTETILAHLLAGPVNQIALRYASINAYL